MLDLSAADQVLIVDLTKYLSRPYKQTFPTLTTIRATVLTFYRPALYPFTRNVHGTRGVFRNVYDRCCYD